MNKIKIKKYKTKFSNSEHLVIFIDGKPLGLFLDEKTSDSVEGLVPSTSWLESDLERNYAIERLEFNRVEYENYMKDLSLEKF